MPAHVWGAAAFQMVAGAREDNVTTVEPALPESPSLVKVPNRLSEEPENTVPKCTHVSAEVHAVPKD